jgi:hypothetical protein
MLCYPMLSSRELAVRTTVHHFYPAFNVTCTAVPDDPRQQLHLSDSSESISIIPESYCILRRARVMPLSREGATATPS